MKDWTALYYADDTAMHVAMGKQGEVMSWAVKCAARLAIEKHVAAPEPDAKGRFKSKSQFVVLPAGAREVTELERQPCFLEGGGVLPSARGYKHLGVWHDESRSSNVEVDRRVKAANMAFRSMTPYVFSNRHLELEAKAKLFIAMVLPALLFGIESLVLSIKGRRRLTTWYYKRVRLLCGVTKKDHFKTMELLEQLGLPLLSYFSRVRQLRWLGELQRMPFERRARQFAFGFLRRKRVSRASVWRDTARNALKSAAKGAAKLPKEVRDSLRAAIVDAQAGGGSGIGAARAARIEAERAELDGGSGGALGHGGGGGGDILGRGDGDGGLGRGSGGGSGGGSFGHSDGGGGGSDASFEHSGRDGGGRGRGGGGRSRGDGGRRGGRGPSAIRRAIRFSNFMRGSRDGDGGGDGDDDDGGLVGAEAKAFTKLIVDNWQILAENPFLFEVSLTAGLEGANFEMLAKNFARRWKPKLRRRRRFQECDELRMAAGDEVKMKEIRKKYKQLKVKMWKNKS